MYKTVYKIETFIPPCLPAKCIVCCQLHVTVSGRGYQRERLSPGEVVIVLLTTTITTGPRDLVELIAILLEGICVTAGNVCNSILGLLIKASFNSN